MASTEKVTIERIDHGVVPSNDLGRAHRFWGCFMGGEIDHLTNLNIRGTQPGSAADHFLHSRQSQRLGDRAPGFANFSDAVSSTGGYRLRLRSRGGEFGSRDPRCRRAET